MTGQFGHLYCVSRTGYSGYVDLAAWIQAVSLIFVSAALLLGALQLKEVSKQSKALRESLNQAAYGSMIETATDAWSGYFRDDPELLEWHLSSRGYKTTSPAENKRRLYAIVKFEEHEANFIAHQQGLIREDVWSAWYNVMEADFDIVEFREVWPVAKKFYAIEYTRFVDDRFGSKFTPSP